MNEEEKENLKKVAIGETTIPFPARWKMDCGGKQDLDCGLVRLSTRYYRDFTSYPSILLGDIEIARAEFEVCETEGEAKQKAEQWAQDMFNRINKAVLNQILPIDETTVDEMALILILRRNADHYRTFKGQPGKAMDLEAIAGDMESMLQGWSVQQEPTKLYLLARIHQPGLDCLRELVVRARSEEEARQTAVEMAQDEGPEEWKDPLQSTCVELTPEGEPGPICMDVLAG